MLRPTRRQKLGAQPGLQPSHSNLDGKNNLDHATTKAAGLRRGVGARQKKNGEEARRKKALVDVSGLAWFNNSLRKMVAYAWQALPTDWTGDVAQPVVYDISFNRLAGSYVPLHVDEPDRDAAGDIVCVFVLEVIHVATTHPTINSHGHGHIYICLANII